MPEGEADYQHYEKKGGNQLDTSTLALWQTNQSLPS
jgi:hypothetical protein